MTSERVEHAFTNMSVHILRVVGLSIVFAGILAAVPTHAQNQESSDVPETHVIGRGESLYMIVATYYPERMSKWTEVAADMVELNPNDFPDGLDTSLKLGREIRLPNYAARNAAAREALLSSNTTDNSGETTRSTEAGANKTLAPTNGSNVNRTEPATLRTQTSRDQNNSDPALTANQSLSDTTTSQQNVRTPRIGVVMSSTGDASATSSIGQPRPLRPGDIVYLGDTVTTPNNVLTTIRLSDDSEFRLKPDSRLVFEHFSVSANSVPQNTVLTLIEGSFSGDTSTTVAEKPHPLTVNTAVATIGVNNSLIGMKICPPPACTTGNTKLDQGLYVGVLQGSVLLTNNTGDVSAIQGDFYRLESPDLAPEHAPYAAPQIFSPSELSRLENPPGSDEPLGFWAWFKHWLFDD